MGILFEPHRQLRVDHEPVKEPSSYGKLEAAGKSALDQDSFWQADKVIERYEEFTIAHIELDDQGEFWDRRQLATLKKHVNTGGDGALFVVFVHGWNNNALPDNGNLKSFRAVLYDLFMTESRLRFTQRPRQIFGVYISWRGAATTLPILRQLTFWSRKQAAHRVGRGHVLEALVNVEQIRRELGGLSRMVTIGHSFGAAAVFSAVSHYVKAVTLKQIVAGRISEDAAANPIPGFGDAVILVNPAFEAMLYRDLDQLMRAVKRYPADQHVVLLTVSAQSDLATRLAFPIGQYLGRILQRKRPHQKPLLRTTCGNLDEFLTHELRLRGEDASVANPDCSEPGSHLKDWVSPAAIRDARALDEQVVLDWESFIPDTRRWEVRDVRKQRAMPYPFMMVRSLRGLIPGHNGLFRVVFVEFLRDFLIAQDLRLEKLAEWREASQVALEGPAGDR